MNKVILGIKLMTGILLIAQVVAVATGHMDIMTHNHSNRLFQGLLHSCQILLHLPTMVCCTQISQK